jgi:hypothetical protein
MKEIISELLKGNPGVVNLLISGLLLPVLILWLNNRQSRKIKELESLNDLRRMKTTREVEREQAMLERQQAHEDVVLSSLYKILFDVQRLHIDLSTHCVDYECIDRAVARFQASFEGYQGVISDNQISLSSTVTGHLYRFYQSLAQLLIEIQDLKGANRPDLALVSVSQHSEALSNEVINIHEAFVQARPSIAKNFKKKDMKEVSLCCGASPPVKDKEAVAALLAELAAKKQAQRAKG